jgi:hypothetical protein
MIISQRKPTALGAITLVLCALSMLFAAVVIPYWFGQAFGYSAAVGRTEVEAKAAAALFECRATTILQAATLLVLGSFAARALQLRLAQKRAWKLSLARSCGEHVFAGVVLWGVLAVTGVPQAVEGRITSMANRLCH